MISGVVYLLLVIGLIYWIESPSPILANQLNFKKDLGTELEDWLKGFSNPRELKAPGRLPSYKFYTEVVELILDLARRLGGNYQDSILHLREGLQSDLQFEKKLKETILGTWLQMLLMVILTWSFIIGALSLTEVKIPFYKLIFIFIWQLLGLLCLPFLLSHFRKKFFADIGKLWKMLYILRSLSRVPMARTEIFKFAGLEEMKSIKQKNLFHIVMKLKDTCQKALQVGGSYDVEILSLMQELRFQEKWHCELFEKRLIVIKLSLLAIFFLPSYLGFIFLLLGDLLTLM